MYYTELVYLGYYCCCFDRIAAYKNAVPFYFFHLKIDVSVMGVRRNALGERDMAKVPKA